MCERAECVLMDIVRDGEKNCPSFLYQKDEKYSSVLFLFQPKFKHYIKRQPFSTQIQILYVNQSLSFAVSARIKDMKLLQLSLCDKDLQSCKDTSIVYEANSSLNLTVMYSLCLLLLSLWLPFLLFSFCLQNSWVQQVQGESGMAGIA